MYCILYEGSLESFRLMVQHSQRSLKILSMDSLDLVTEEFYPRIA